MDGRCVIPASALHSPQLPDSNSDDWTLLHAAQDVVQSAPKECQAQTELQVAVLLLRAVCQHAGIPLLARLCSALEALLEARMGSAGVTAALRGAWQTRQWRAFEPRDAAKDVQSSVDTVCNLDMPGFVHAVEEHPLLRALADAGAAEALAAQRAVRLLSECEKHEQVDASSTCATDASSVRSSDGGTQRRRTPLDLDAITNTVRVHTMRLGAAHPEAGQLANEVLWRGLLRMWRLVLRGAVMARRDAALREHTSRAAADSGAPAMTLV